MITPSAAGVVFGCFRGLLSVCALCLRFADFDFAMAVVCRRDSAIRGRGTNFDLVSLSWLSCDLHSLSRLNWADQSLWRGRGDIKDWVVPCHF